MFKGYTQWHSHISSRLTSSYGHTSMAVRLIYAEALEVGHLGRLQRERQRNRRCWVFRQQPGPPSVPSTAPGTPHT